ncbi:N-acetylglucosamine kinase [Bacillus horti]|uniref:N-acetylglucosamine kinase-like BadF-type ATPase n=1 Tax=Caldalkalibacillus horti TaxID=77523 RepID=A0ABT9VZ83_9BACI|nr:BadF/BadG/BcrA/BcrD ATPase family protein [Bacillus horti]MDQ0166312.1 N-acetylglucosamine kinase-like BadF-type ATPase [Bacillus horti]
MYIIGIDGGGTKTTGAVANIEGSILASVTVGPTNPNSMEQSYIKAQFEKLFVHLADQIPNLFQHTLACFAGVAGADRPSNKQLLTETLTELLPSQTKIGIDNDAVNALFSGSLGEPGVVNIAGTGSICFGINDEGKRQRVGGWGYLLGDPGSGYAIGRAACIAFYHAVDGRGKETLLSQLILEHFEVSSPYELLEHIYDMERSRTVISSVTKLVFLAADQGDKIAIQILKQAAVDMAEQMDSLVSQLYAHKASTDFTVPVVLAGGIYQRSDWFLPIIQEQFRDHSIQTQFIIPDQPPVYGAIVAAKKLI